MERDTRQAGGHTILEERGDGPRRERGCDRAEPDCGHARQRGTEWRRCPLTTAYRSDHASHGDGRMKLRRRLTEEQVERDGRDRDTRTNPGTWSDARHVALHHQKAAVSRSCSERPGRL